MRAFALGIALTLVAAPARADDEAAGRAAIERYGCTNCHVVPGFAPDPVNGCVACHDVVARHPRSAFRGSPPVTHYVRVPDLSRVVRRVRAAWIEAWLRDPHDVRPHLPESMPRLPVTPADASTIVAYLRAHTEPVRPAPAAPGLAAVALRAPPAPSATRIARGREVFAAAGCPSCHVFGNVDFAAGTTARFFRDMREQALLAPNLRFARERLDPAVALAWILDPGSIDPNTTMPRPELPYGDAVAVRDFLFLADPGPAVAAAPALTAADLAPLGRPVHFAEVRRVFARSCIHCHAHTNSMTATANLGFRRLGLDLSSREGVLAGSIGPDGARRSIVDSAPGRVPILLERLLLRHAESPRDLQRVFRDPLGPGLRRTPSTALVGMPLGLPPLSLGELRVVATWIGQGTL